VLGSLPSLFIVCLILTLVQFLAALPWVLAYDPQTIRRTLRQPSALANAGVFMLLIAAAGAALVWYLRGSMRMELYGRLYGSILHLQLVADVFALGLWVVLKVWPKGGAVALAAFREGIRNPMFWLLGGGAILVTLVAMVFPYFTFGDDYKMMKQLGFDIAMLAGVLFGVLAASISIHDEIEGRTAVTLMSKPITRRQFLLGKYVGIVAASFALTLLIGWALTWALYIKPYFDRLDDVTDQFTQQTLNILQPLAQKVKGDSAPLIQGLALWVADSAAHHLGLLLGFGKVMVLVAIASTLATRLNILGNLFLNLLVFFLGHLAPMMRRVTEDLKETNPNAAIGLVGFLAQLLDTLMPALELFNMGPAIIRDTPISLGAFAVYVMSVCFYAVVYTAIALLFGLILFEDRDLA
jgi:hypothetical protein